MRKTFLMIPALLAVAFAAQADVVQMPEAGATAPAAEAPAQLPAKGSKMAAVSKQYGEPLRKHPAAGGDTRRHPPITRWDYAGFSVFFERGLVIDAVVPAEPAPVHNVEELKAN